MDFDYYQKQAKKTAIYPRQGKNHVYPTLGLAGEVGEVSGKVSKIMRDSGEKISEEVRQDLKKELGDVLWYIAQLATELKLSLSDIAEANVKKLESRRKRDVLHGSGDDR